MYYMRLELDNITINQIKLLIDRLAIGEDAKRSLSDHIRDRIARALNRESYQEIDHLSDYVTDKWMEHRIEGDNPVTFIQRVYARWLGNGLSRSHIREVDPQLYRAFYNWAANHELPEGFNLPTQREVSAAVIARATGGPLGNDDSDPLESPSQARKLLNALRYRDTKSKQERER